MSKASERASAARNLLNNTTFREVMDAIRHDAIGIFSNANTSMEAIAAAHERVRAVQTVLDELDTRIADQLVEDKRNKKDQHRVND